ncbi:MAG: type II toxin-antitoxin system HicA family toxin [Dehalococcoidia bacterium]
MKRSTLLKHLESNDCELGREGARHSMWKSRAGGALVAVPRHREIDNQTARVICRQLGIPDPRG